MDTLYHYTNLDAFLSILRNKRLWLTGAHNLNDYREISWTLTKVEKRLAELAGEFNEESINLLDRLIKGNMATPYICSLSTESDLLSQWRAYGKDGTGVAIGFRKDLLPKSDRLPFRTVAKADSIKTHPVIYSDSEQDERLKDVIRRALEGIENPSPDNQGSSMYAVSEIVGLATVFKNSAFEEEHEWRIVHLPFITSEFKNKTQVYVSISEPQHRVANNKLVTYFEYDLSSLVDDGIFSELVLGPRCEISDYDLSILLASVGLHSLQYRRSAASYR